MVEDVASSTNKLCVSSLSVRSVLGSDGETHEVLLQSGKNRWVDENQDVAAATLEVAKQFLAHHGLKGHCVFVKSQFAVRPDDNRHHITMFFRNGKPHAHEMARSGVDKSFNRALLKASFWCLKATIGHFTVELP